MLARFVRLALLLEAAAYAAIGAWLAISRGASPVAVLLGAVACALMVRLALVCFTSLLGWLNRSPREPSQCLGAWASARLVLGEWRAMLADNFFYLPFESLAVRPDPPARAGEGIAVILVHGYLSNRGYWRTLVRGLEAAGVGPIYTPSFPTLFCDIERFVGELHEYIERIATRGGHERVVLVCHSMGGLAAREYIRTRTGARIARLVTIASPHHGTALARLGLGANAAQMRPGSAFLAALQSSEGPSGPGVAAASIYSVHDNLVSPQATSRLPWARNTAFAGLGHIDILAAPRLLQAVRAELREAGVAGA